MDKIIVLIITLKTQNSTQGTFCHFNNRKIIEKIKKGKKNKSKEICYSIVKPNKI